MRTEEKEPDEGPTENKFAINPSTPVTLGLIVTLVMGIATAAWKMSNISTKLDSISLKLDQSSTSGMELARKVGDHERDDSRMWQEIKAELSVIKTAGTPKAQELEKLVHELESRLVIHERTHQATRP